MNAYTITKTNQDEYLLGHDENGDIYEKIITIYKIEDPNSARYAYIIDTKEGNEIAKTLQTTSLYVIYYDNDNERQEYHIASYNFDDAIKVALKYVRTGSPF